MFGTFEMAVVEWETDAVEPKALEESSICILEERLNELYITPGFSFVWEEALAGVPDRRNIPIFLFRWSRRGPLGSGIHILDTLNKRLEGVARYSTRELPLMKFSMLRRLARSH